MTTKKSRRPGVRVNDGLQNVVANLGTGRDKMSSNVYVHRNLSWNELLTMYRNSWLSRSIVDYPAEDATRKWRSWLADPEQITLIEKLEKKLKLKSRVKEALVSARLFGGAAIYINTQTEDQASPLIPGEEIKSLAVLSRIALIPGDIVRDINSEYYGKPELYQVTSAGTVDPVWIHASRLIRFIGADIPDEMAVAAELAAWGDSVLQSALDSIQQTDSTMANMASLVFEAKVDVFKFKGWAEMLADAGNDAMLTRRLTSQAAMKGINGAVVIDAEDDFQQKNASFSGLHDIVSRFLDSVAGAARIPVTRLFGRAAVGLSGSGDGDERVYYDRIEDIQTGDIGEAMAHFDECLVRQALGSNPPEVHYKWNPLRQLTQAERAEIFQKTANGARALAGTAAGAIIPLDALSDAVVNEFVEQGALPGLEAAVEKYGSLADQSGFVGEDPLPAARVTDAAPAPLYVSRKVENAEEILGHYALQGVTGLVSADDMHVTITYSRAPVNWMKMGEALDSELEIPEGGARLSEAFGPDKNTLVLSFVSSQLSWRHEDMVMRGASWDWPDYQPHVSISYDFSGDASTIKPWTGEIEFGPEVFEPLNEDWKGE